VLGVCLLVAIALAGLYGVFAVTSLLGATRRSEVRRSTQPEVTGAEREAASDRPRFVSRGEAFEVSWQGSRGYDRPQPRVNENLADRLFVSVFFMLRPSRFADRTYWRTYMPIVIGLSAVIFVGLPLVAFLIFPTSSETAFAPIQHRAVAAGTVHQRIACPGASGGSSVGPADPALGPVTTVSADDPGATYLVATGGRVVIRYYYGYPPAFSPGTPLCPSGVPGFAGTTGGLESVHEMDFVASGIGSGFVYFPEPGGSAYVARIEMVRPRGEAEIELATLLGVVVIADVLIGRRLRSIAGGRVAER